MKEDRCRSFPVLPNKAFEQTVAARGSGLRTAVAAHRSR
jgi:hypothetical protein